MAGQLAPGTLLNRGQYRIERYIGGGGFSDVYLAREMQGRPVAIKRCLSRQPDDMMQFGSEMTILQLLGRHPTFFKVYTTFSDTIAQYGALASETYAFAAVEFIPGETLEELAQRRNQNLHTHLTEAEVVPWFKQILSALQFAHKNHIIHRDIKPTNVILMPNGVVRILDPGIAKITGSNTPAAAHAVSVGFSPPEQYALSGKTQPQSDIYAVGATLYALLTGHDPPDALALKHHQATLTAPRAHNRAISAKLEAIILKAMSLEIDDRYQSVATMRAALTRLAPPPLLMKPCPHCQADNSQAAKFCNRCGAVMHPPTLAIGRDQVIRLYSLPFACDRSWNDAAASLRAGQLEAWLNNLGKPGRDVLPLLAQARAPQASEDFALDSFLSALDPTRAAPRLRVAPNPLTAMSVASGATGAQVVNLHNISGAPLQVSLIASESWVTFKPATLQIAAGQQANATFSATPPSLRAGNSSASYKVLILMRYGGGSMRVQLPVAVKPAAPVMAIVGAPVQMGSMAYGEERKHQLMIQNKGGGVLRAALAASDPWLNVAPANVDVPAHGAVPVDVSISTQVLGASGPHRGAVTVTASGAGQASVPVEVKMERIVRLDGGRSRPIATLGELIDWCDDEWAKALALLKSGQLGQAAAYLGCTKEQRFIWTQAQAIGGPVALEEGLRALGAELPDFVTNWRSVARALGLGLFPRRRGARPSAVDLEIHHTGRRGYLSGKVVSLVEWVKAPAGAFGALPGQRVNVRLEVDQALRRVGGIVPRILSIQID